MDRNKLQGTYGNAKRVALRKESVDRNLTTLSDGFKVILSLSARRAWIEIEEQTEQESTVEGRSPQGERG